MNKKSFIWISFTVLIIALIATLLIFKKTDNDNDGGHVASNVSELFEDLNNQKVSRNLIDEQKEIDKTIKEYQKDKDYTLDDAKVIINPYRISPLTGLIIFNTSNKVSVSIQINEGEKISFEEGKQHTIPVYGLMPDTENKVTITTSDNKTKTYILKTDKVPTDIKPMTVKESDKVKLTNDLYFFTTPQINYPFAYDNSGNVRWYLTGRFQVAPIVMDNGHLLLGNGVTRDAYTSQTGFVEIDLLGRVYNEYISDYGYHHDIIIKDNNFIFVGNNPKRVKFLDYIVEMDNKGNVVKTWDLTEIIGRVDKEYADSLSYVWAWINSVYYDKASNSLILSLRGKNSVISIDYATSNINWIFGSKTYWSDKLASYILETEEDTTTPLGQHSAFITTEGYLGLFNNNYDSSDHSYSAPCSSLKDKYSTAMLYEIHGKKIKSIMEYSDNKNIYSFALSNFKVLSNNNRLILSGWEFKDSAYNNANCDAFSNMDLTSRVIELDQNNNVLFDATIDEGTYRVDKLSLYNSGTKKINLTEYKKYGLTADLLPKEVNLKDRLDKIKNAEVVPFEHHSDTDRMSVSAYYPKESEIKILFVSASGKGYEFVIKAKDEIDARYVYTSSFKGKYRVYIIWDEQYLDTELILDY